MKLCCQKGAFFWKKRCQNVANKNKIMKKSAKHGGLLA